MSLPRSTATAAISDVRTIEIALLRSQSQLLKSHPTEHYLILTARHPGRLQVKCLRECDPRSYYCAHCDSNEAIDPLASYMPFVDIRFVCGFYGKAWRTIWYNKDASAALKLLCLLLIIYFAPILLIVGLPLLLIEKIRDARLKKPHE